MATRIELPRKATAASWYSVLRAHQEIASAPGEIVVDASRTERVEPFGATVLALAVASREHSGLPPASWVPPQDEVCREFLEEIAFPLYVRGTPSERDAARWHDTLEMRQVRVLDPSYLAGLAELLVRLVPGTTEEMSHLVQLCLTELVTNARDHARSPVGCFMLVRWYKEKGNVRIAIADAGETIPGVLREQPRYAGHGDRELLRAAVMTEGVTSRKQRRGGYGLKNIRDVTTQREGGLIVVSRTAKFEVRGPTNPARESLKDTGMEFRGTAIEIDFRPGVEVEDSGEEVF